MTREERLWVDKQLRRLHRQGAPRDVVERWKDWLAAIDQLPDVRLRDLIASELDDSDAALPAPLAVEFN